MTVQQPIAADSDAAFIASLITEDMLRGSERFPSPHVELWTMPGFLTPEECDVLMRAIDANKAPSRVAYGEPNARTSETCIFDATVRSSETCVLDDTAPVIQLLDLKLSLLLGIPPECGEPIQGQRYAVGQEFKLHHDYFEDHHPDTASNRHRCGNRTWTAMIYLNEPEEGGETGFAYLQHDFKPRQGMAVCWNNVGLDGKPNRYTLHQGKPVIRGDKYIITKWFRERAWLGPVGYVPPAAAPQRNAKAKVKRAIKGRR
ncbi:2OG-Fe(II) oxygenase [Sphingomonas sanguinis]|uniref:prolyl hydroxylase family protein n=1 Tax=Sphingomonas sanguinis TaxID=33051 RepID=UPI001C57E8D8|nr:2OG-Fe(II) oxygenase [Sphingomonas sanguinis]QXT35211.1 2OG-Fe(II) oxygenase [Sphingomonas sanguinis]